MKKLIFVLTFALLPLVGWAQQQNYYGQHVSIKQTTGDSVQYDIATSAQFKPVIKEGKVVWSFQNWVDKENSQNNEIELKEMFTINNVESFDFRSFEYDNREVRKALIEFYQAMDGDNWPEKYKENWCSDKPIWEWYGVNQVGGVTKLPWVSTLDVQSLCLDTPRQIPDCISRMGPIKFLWLSQNNFIGSIPEFLGWNYNLLNLELGRNNLSGPFPKSFMNFQKMRDFWAFGAESNKFEGSLPEDFIISLMDKIPGNNLNLINNNFTGIVPESIKNHPQFSNFWPSILIQEGDGITLTDLSIPAPVFTAKDINGNTINTAEIYKKNKYTLLYKWAWWCPYSNAFSLKLIPAYRAYKDKGFEVVGLSSDSNNEETRKYINEHGIQWTSVFYEDWNWRADGNSNDNIAIFSWGGIPHIFLVDQNGNIVFNDLMDEKGHWTGGANREKLFSFLEEKLGPVEYDFYTSTDYLQDGEVSTLQTATIGQGVDLVFVGEGFTDKDINEGLFTERMNQALDQFFAYEPYKSLQNRFNVYAVKTVSPNSEFYGSNAVHAIDEDNAKALEYASKVTSLIPNRPMRVNVIYNNNSGGRSYCVMMEDDSYVCYAMDGVTTVLNHEAGGHGIGKLLDEYVEYPGETLPEYNRTILESRWTTLGWGANVDWRSTPTDVKWAKFINDEHYAAENIGVYEGSYLYQYGAYRPTENSMMRYNDTPFNAPSREEIYKRVMKESEGDSWTYDYDTFVTFDAAGHSQFVKAINANLSPKNNAPKVGEKRQVLTAPPVFVKGTWRDVLKQKKQ